MASHITKVVIPAAGYGTRLLPVTKASPKEMLPLVDKPIIQRVVEEAVAAGLTDVILVTGQNKRALEDHFDYNFELEYKLQKDGKTELYEEIRRISDMARFVYVRQKEPRGNGHAVLQAKDIVDNDPFAVMWADEFIETTAGTAIGVALEAFARLKAPILVLTEPPEGQFEDYCGRFGNVKVEATDHPTTFRILDFKEKPKPEEALSHYFQLGGFVLTPDIFKFLESEAPDGRGEIVLGNAVLKMIKSGVPVFGALVKGEYYDMGNKLNFLEANVEMGLRHPETAEAFTKYLKERAQGL